MYIKIYIKESFFMKMKIGFTLAEVLITLGIIGIVAAMSIPSLINKVQEITFKSKLKKSYSLLSQTVKLMLADDNAYMGKCRINDSKCLGEMFGKYMKFVNAEAGTSYFKGCWEDSYTPNISEPKYCATTADGVVYLFDMEWEKPHQNDEGDTVDVIAYILVDVNGTKLPNKYGIDRFIFHMNSNDAISLKYGGKLKGCSYGKSNYPYSNMNCAYEVLTGNKDE